MMYMEELETTGTASAVMADGYTAADDLSTYGLAGGALAAGLLVGVGAMAGSVMTQETNTYVEKAEAPVYASDLETIDMDNMPQEGIGVDLDITRGESPGVDLEVYRWDSDPRAPHAVPLFRIRF